MCCIVITESTFRFLMGVLFFLYLHHHDQLSASWPCQNEESSRLGKWERWSHIFDRVGLIRRMSALELFEAKDPEKVTSSREQYAIW